MKSPFGANAPPRVGDLTHSADGGPSGRDAAPVEFPPPYGVSFLLGIGSSRAKIVGNFPDVLAVG